MGEGRKAGNQGISMDFWSSVSQVVLPPYLFHLKLDLPEGFQGGVALRLQSLGSPQCTCLICLVPVRRELLMLSLTSRPVSYGCPLEILVPISLSDFSGSCIAPLRLYAFDHISSSTISLASSIPEPLYDCPHNCAPPQPCCLDSHCVSVPSLPSGIILPLPS